MQWWIFFLWLLDQEPANKVYFGILVFLMFLMAVGIVMCVVHFFKERKQPSHNKKMSFTAVMTLIIAAISFFPIQELIKSYNNVIQKTYTEAETYFADDYQKAKELYTLIDVTGFKDCREKIALCDLKSAQAYGNGDEYASAFSVLFPYLSTDSQFNDTDVLNKMHEFLASTIEDVSQINQASEMLIDNDWMLGEWSDEAGSYMRFYVDSFDRKITHAASNILVHHGDKKYEFSFSYGIYSRREENVEDFTTELIFIPLSEDASFAYNLLSGKMYHLSRNTNLE